MTVAETRTVSDLITVPTLAGRQARVRAEGLDDPDGLSWLMDRAEELLHVDPSTAEGLCELVAGAAEARGHIAAVARAHYAWARVCAERGDLDRALEMIAEARRVWSACGAELSALRTDLGRMQILDDLGRHGQAAQVGENLLQTLKTIPIDRADEILAATLRAAAMGNVGVAHSFTGEHERSLEAYAASEELYAELDLPTQVAQQRANRGIELIALGRPREAKRALRSAQQTFASAGDRLWAAKCGVHLAEAEQLLGELVDALRVLEAAREELVALGAGAEEARAQLQIGRAYLAAGMNAEARAAAEAAARQAAESGMRHDAGFARLTLALALLASDDLDAAQRELDAAAGLFAAVEDRQFQARVVLAQAELTARRDDLPGSRLLLARAIQELGEGGWQVPLAWARLRQAELATSSVHRFQLLADLSELVASLGLPELRLAHRVQLARVLIDSGDRSEAEKLLRGAMGTVDTLGSRLPDPMLRIAFRSDRLAAHDSLVELLVRRDGPGDAEEACRISDRAKSQTLHDLAQGTVGVLGLTGHDKDLDPTTLEAARLREDLSATYGTLSNATEPTRRVLLRARAERLEEELSTLRMRRALGEDPRMGDAQGASSVNAAQDRPPAISFHVIGDDLAVFVVHGREVDVRILPSVMTAARVALDRLASQWNRFGFGSAFSRRHGDMLRATTVEILHELYSLLIEPVRDLLDALGSETLVVVPHRDLHRVPFQALHDGTDHLARHWAVTISTTLPDCAGEPTSPRPEGGLLALAVPDSRSPLISHEVGSVSSIVDDSEVLHGTGATRDALRTRLPGPKYLHLACHGLYRAANPMFSALRLSDGWLTGAEVMELELGGALVVLSACESGRSSRHTAEPIGLAWAFLAAGASGAVVSQWLVDDEVTVEVMQELYARLSAGEPPARALQQAQLVVATHHAHPYYWAPFVYVGAPRSSAITGGTS